MRKIILSFLMLSLLLTGLTVKAAPQNEPQQQQPKAFILVHGAWHGAWAWDYMIPLLSDRGNNKIVPIDLPGSGRDQTPVEQVTLGSYGDRICETLASYEDFEVNLVAHSMGGMAASDAGEKCADLIDRIIYVAAFLPQKNQSLFDLDGLPESLNAVAPVAFPTLLLTTDGQILAPAEFGAALASGEQLEVARPMDLFIDLSDMKSLFYNNVLNNTDEIVGNALRQVRPQPFLPLAQPFVEITKDLRYLPKYYVETQFDNTISIDLQRVMHQARDVDGVYNLRTDHSPFLSQPEELAEIILEISDL